MEDQRCKAESWLVKHSTNILKIYIFLEIDIQHGDAPFTTIELQLELQLELQRNNFTSTAISKLFLWRHSTKVHSCELIAIVDPVGYRLV